MSRIIMDFIQWMPDIPMAFITTLISLAIGVVVLKIVLFIVQVVGEWVPFT